MPRLTPDECRARVAVARVAHLATIDPDGRPHLVPITFAVDGDTLFFAVDHKPKSTTNLKRLANIERDARVTLLVDHYDDDWAALWWCRLRASATVVAQGPAASRALELLAAKYDQYKERLPSGPVVAIDVAEWSGWEASVAKRPATEG